MNCVKWPKHRKDHLITRDMLLIMKKGSVIVDNSADVDGAIETYKSKIHANPTYVFITSVFIFYITFIWNLLFFSHNKKLADLDPKRGLIPQAEQPPLSEVF
ncbi:hypothetical protein J7E52_22875 [Bacillus sp. ISL-34]|nr:hypothetical protein [Bacillus sp. ISL-34]